MRVAGAAAKKRRFKLTAPEPREDELHATVARMLKYAFANQKVAFTHFPSGGYFLTPAAKARLFRLGLMPGFADILIQWAPGKSLWIELKTHVGRLSNAQKANSILMAEIGIPYVVCRSPEEVLRTLRSHRIPMNRMIIQGDTSGDIQTEGGSAA